MTHLMIDTETLSTTPRAALLQVGWCVFEPSEIASISHTREANVDVDSCMRLGGEVSDGTVSWWLEQSPAARASVAKPGVDICNVVAGLVEDFRAHGCKQVWAHSPSFDVVIIEHYMRALGVAVPWKFWDLHDTRTLFSMAAATGWQRPKAPTAHTAAADAVAQALDVQRAWRHVTGAGRRAAGPDPTDPSFRAEP